MKKIIKNTILLSLLLVFFSSCTDKKDNDFKQFEILTLAKEVSEYYNILLDLSGDSESAELTTNILGTRELNYNYLSPANYFSLSISMFVKKILQNSKLLKTFMDY